MSFPVYPQYKKSGAEWLGSIPAHWTLKRLRLVASINPSKKEASHLPRTEGDVLLAKITPCFENGKGAMARNLVEGLGFGTTELIVSRPLAGEVTSDFLH
jgi:type I restriction enzyme S subunit